MDNNPNKKEQKLLKKDIIMLVILIIVLLVTSYFSYSVFTNYQTTSKEITNSKDTTPKKKKKEVKKDSEYECNKPFNGEFFRIPHQENIYMNSYEGNTIYTFKKDLLYTIVESFHFTYSNIDDNQNKEITRYCNSYNAVYDTYKLICKYSKRTLTITNTFNIYKLKTNTITNNEYTFNLTYDKNTNSEKVIEDDNTCEKTM